MLRRVMTRLVFLGPEGTFTHQAALALAPADAQLAPLSSLDAVLEAVRGGQAEYAVAAETSAAGPIAATCAAIERGEVEVVSRHGIAVSFDLYRRPGDGSVLTGVYGHEKALAQIAPWLAARGLKAQALASNTAGLAAVRDGDEPGWGAAGPPGLAAKYALEVTEQALEGPARHETVFVLLRRRA